MVGCLICFEALDNKRPQVKQLCCGEVYHFSCLFDWYREQRKLLKAVIRDPSCPKCNQTAFQVFGSSEKEFKQSILATMCYFLFPTDNHEAVWDWITKQDTKKLLEKLQTCLSTGKAITAAELPGYPGRIDQSHIAGLKRQFNALRQHIILIQNDSVKRRFTLPELIPGLTHELQRTGLLAELTSTWDTMLGPRDGKLALTERLPDQVLALAAPLVDLGAGGIATSYCDQKIPSNFVMITNIINLQAVILLTWLFSENVKMESLKRQMESWMQMTGETKIPKDTFLQWDKNVTSSPHTKFIESLAFWAQIIALLLFVTTPGRSYAQTRKTQMLRIVSVLAFLGIFYYYSIWGIEF